MADHYETLGVDRTASPDEVRAAFRRASSRAHPDKGGTDVQQQAVNAAYEVLSDPQRREAYDQFGDESAGPSVKRRAAVALQSLVAQKIDQPWDDDLLGYCRKTINNALAQDGAQRKDLLGRRELLVGKSNKVRRKDGAVGRNLVQDAFDAKLAEIDAKLAELDDRKALHTEALELLDQYEQDPPPVQTMFSTSGYSGPATTCTTSGIYWNLPFP